MNDDKYQLVYSPCKILLGWLWLRVAGVTRDLIFAARDGSDWLP